ncbi:MAG: carboxylating nicotinate-nucleotide diphosphorylase [Verrucomicrobiota bacterium]
MDDGVLQLIDLALGEDIGAGDVTALYFVPETAWSTGVIVAREELVVAGTEVAREVIRRVDQGIEVEIEMVDGTEAKARDVVMYVAGPTRGILTAERTVLNFLQRLSGVATMTRRFVEAAGGRREGVEILDTRKTTPGWRILEKEAVRAGGGGNHRMGLFDQVMVKDNHLLAEGRRGEIQAAIDRVKGERSGMKVELEADTLEQVETFLELKGVDVILLDNMSVEDMREAVTMTKRRVRLEASGGVTLETVGAIADTGVDYISVGALTHSAVAVDLALDLETSDEE